MSMKVNATVTALTMQDAMRLEAPQQLRLIHRKLTALPQGLNALTSLTSLDLSDNPITRAELHPECLPTCLKELVLVGCHLSGRLPPSLTRLTALERFVASTNAIQEADAVFACQHLLHAGLAYNHVSSLVNSTNRSSTSRSSISAADRSSCPSAAAGVLASSRVMCLDLAHNDITDLQLILQQLQQLPTLKALSLKGNPISLLPHYRATVLQQLPQLVYLDGQSVQELRALAMTGTPAGERAAAGGGAGEAVCDLQQPAASTAAGLAAATAVPAAASNECAPTAAVVTIILELGKLQVSSSPSAVFEGLTAEAAACLQHLMQQQQQQQQTSLPSRPTTAAAGQTTSSVCGVGQSSDTTGSPGTTTSATGSQFGSAQFVTGSSSSSSGGVEAALKQATVPLLPITYHLQLCGPDGCGLCSATALVVSPPLQPAAEPVGPGGMAVGASVSAAVGADNSKKKESQLKGAKQAAHQDTNKAAAAAKQPRPAGSSVRPSSIIKSGGAAAADEAQQAAMAAAAAEGALQPGCLRVQLCAPADVATRDWLRSGFDVRLILTKHQPRPVLSVQDQISAGAAVPTAAPPAQPPAPAAVPKLGAAAAAAKPASKPSAASTVSSSGSTQQQAVRSSISAGESSTLQGCLVSWDQELKQEELGIAKVCVPALVDGNTKEDSGCAAFMPPAPLLHPVTGASKATRAPGTSCQLCVQADVSGLLTCGWLMGIV